MARAATLKFPRFPTRYHTDLTAFQLRDVLLALNPLDRDWVVKVNTAEAEFWKR